MKIATYVRSALAASTLLLAVGSLPAVADNTFYQVNNVQNDDALNIRSGAGANYPVIGTIPHNGRTVMSTGQTAQNGRSTWVEVVWLGQIGWVNNRFLSDSVQQQQPVNNVQQAAPVQNNANAHTHPSNRCTRSITHVHPSNSSSHQHRYSCDPNGGANNAPAPAMKNNYQAQVPADPNSHIHPRNECTNSITHTHPNGAGSHQHRYSCDKNRNNAPAVKSNYQANVPADPNSHAHPRNECTNSITHTHPNGAGSHQHRYSCKQSATQSAATPKYNPQPKYNNTNDYYAIQ